MTSKSKNTRGAMAYHMVPLVFNIFLQEPQTFAGLLIWIALYTIYRVNLYSTKSII